MVKALIRNSGETIVYPQLSDLINWDTGYPLTDPDWRGGSYRLIDDYEPPEQESNDSYSTSSIPTESTEKLEQTETVEESSEDKTYTLEEAKQILGI